MKVSNAYTAIHQLEEYAWQYEFYDTFKHKVVRMRDPAHMTDSHEVINRYRGMWEMLTFQLQALLFTEACFIDLDHCRHLSAIGGWRIDTNATIIRERALSVCVSIHTRAGIFYVMPTTKHEQIATEL